LISQDEFVALVKLRNFERLGRPDYLAYRSRAAALLAYGAGLWFPEIMSLRRPHWMRDGGDCIFIEATAQRAPRTIPASPAVIWAVQRFLAERRPRIRLSTRDATHEGNEVDRAADPSNPNP
jgi:integrase